MHIPRRISWLKISGGLLAGIALVALTACYPYPYHYGGYYGHGSSKYSDSYKGKRHYYHGGYNYHRKRYKRYRHYRYY